MVRESLRMRKGRRMMLENWRGSGGGGRRDSPPIGPIGGFFLSGFSLRFPLFLAREGFQVEVYVGPMLELVLGGVLERSWSDLGRFLGGQDGPKTPTRWPTTPTRRPKTRP